MPSKPSAADGTRDPAIARTLASAAIVVALAVLIGWWLDIAVLKAVVPGFVTMKPITAFTFLLTATAVLLQSWRVVWPGRALGLAVVGIAGATLTQYATGTSLGIDLILFPDALLKETAGSFPGRMASITATNFLALGLAIALHRLRIWRGLHPSELLALVTVLGGALPLIAYAFGAQEMYRSLGGSTIAIHTATLFVMLAFASMLPPQPGGLIQILFATERRALRWVLPLALMVGLLLTWLRLRGIAANPQGAELSVDLFVYANAGLSALLIWLVAEPVHHAQKALRASNRKLTERVAARTRELEIANAERLRAERAAAEAVSRAKDQFIAMVSHEIRTPLNAVIGMSELLQDTPLTAEQSDFVRILHVNGEHLLDLIEDLLDFSRIEAKTLSLETRPFDLQACIEDSLDVVGITAAEKGLAVTWEIADGTPAVVVGDEKRLRQILVNLLGNAVKFTQQGAVRLAVAAEPVGDRYRFCFRVTDTGIGMSPQTCARIFQPFMQADSSTTRIYGGTGLGLSICKRLAELMGGAIEVASELGAGSTFTFTLVAPATADRRLSERDISANIAGLRILCADDNAANRRILGSMLTSAGASPALAETPEQALGMAGQGDWHLAVLDLNMPGMSGLQLAKALRERIPGLPVLLLTSAFPDETERKQAQATMLLKPIKRSSLLRAVAAAAGRASDSAPARTEPHAAPQPLRILLAEDVADNVKLALHMLRKLGYEDVDVVGNGCEAVEAVSRKTYDVVLMDLMMPQMDGFDATRQICARWPASRPAIIAVTASVMQDDRERCLAAGMDDHISKPLRRDQLRDSLSRCARRAA